MELVHKLKINLILNDLNKGWIIQKFALRLEENLVKLGHEVKISNAPDRDAQINHFMSYNFVVESYNITTAMITHIDDIFKVNHIKSLADKNDIHSFICMSEFTRNQLIDGGLISGKLSVVLPAADSFPPRRRIKIAMSGRVYRDGRKNESWLLKLSSAMDLSNFEFHFFGSGWGEINTAIHKANGMVELYPETENFSYDYDSIINALPNLDYWLYLGFDEGSMGSLDAFLAGLPLICTPQGFHLDLKDGIAFSVETADDLIDTFKKLDRAYLSQDTFESYWTWERYAKDYLEIWQGYPNFISRHSKTSLESNLSTNYSNLLFLAKSFHPSRILGAIGRSKIGLKLRRVVKR